MKTLATAVAVTMAMGMASASVQDLVDLSLSQSNGAVLEGKWHGESFVLTFNGGQWRHTTQNIAYTKDQVHRIMTGFDGHTDINFRGNNSYRYNGKHLRPMLIRGKSFFDDRYSNDESYKGGFVFNKDHGWSLNEISKGVWQDSNGNIVDDKHAAKSLAWGSTEGNFADYDGGLVTGYFQGKPWTLTEIDRGVWLDTNGTIVDDMHVSKTLAQKGINGFGNITGGFKKFNGGVVEHKGHGWVLTEIAEGVWQDTDGSMRDNAYVERALTWDGVTGELSDLFFDAKVDYNNSSTFIADFNNPVVQEIEQLRLDGVSDDVINILKNGTSLTVHRYTNSDEYFETFLKDSHGRWYRTIYGSSTVIEYLSTDEVLHQIGRSLSHTTGENSINTFSNTSVFNESSRQVDVLHNLNITGKGVSIEVVLDDNVIDGLFRDSNQSVAHTGIDVLESIAIDSDINMHTGVTLNFNKDIVNIQDATPNVGSISFDSVNTDALIVQAQAYTGESSDFVIDLSNSHLRDQVMVVGAVELVINGDSKDGILDPTKFFVEIGDDGLGKITNAAASGRVTGKAALLMSKFPNLSASQVVDRFAETAIDLGDAGVDSVYGNGLVNLHGAIFK